MNTLLRSLIVWLLLLAVPFQGMAAVATDACLPQHSPVHVMPAQVMPMAEQMHGATPPCHEAAMPGAASGHEPATPHHQAGKCGTCSACGIGSAVLPTFLPQLAAHAPVAAASPAAINYLPSVHLAQPERPPRPLLA